MNKFIFKKNPGFTLLETLLYFAVASSILLAASSYAAFIIRSKTKYQAMSEVEEQGNFILRTITQTIQNSEVVNNPGANLNSNELVLTPYNSDGETITYREADSGLVKITSLGEENLTNSKVNVSNLNFINLKKPGTPDLIRIEFKLASKSDSTNNEYIYSSAFYASGSVFK